MIDFQIKEYGRTELALIYSPDITPGAAWRKLRRWIDASPGLTDRLAQSGYNPSRRSFTPVQVQLIVEAVGLPRRTAQKDIYEKSKRYI